MHVPSVSFPDFLLKREVPLIRLAQFAIWNNPSLTSAKINRIRPGTGLTGGKEVIAPPPDIGLMRQKIGIGEQDFGGETPKTLAPQAPFKKILDKFSEK